MCFVKAKIRKKQRITCTSRIEANIKNKARFWSIDLRKRYWRGWHENFDNPVEKKPLSDLLVLSCTCALIHLLSLTFCFFKPNKETVSVKFSRQRLRNVFVPWIIILTCFYDQEQKNWTRFYFRVGDKCFQIFNRLLVPRLCCVIRQQRSEGTNYYDWGTSFGN